MCIRDSFHPWNYLSSGNNVGYFFPISFSGSQVAFAILLCFQSILILLFLSFFSILSDIHIGSSTYVRFSLICKGSHLMTWSGFETCFQRLDTWNTLGMPCSEGGTANWYAARPTFCRIAKDPTNLGLSFLFWPNLMLLLSGETFRNTWSPTLNSKGLLLISAWPFCILRAGCSLLHMVLINLIVWPINSTLGSSLSPTSSQ